MLGAAGFLSRHWGDYGYRISLEAAMLGGGGLFGCRCSDGSEFWIYSDRYGNARQVERAENGDWTARTTGEVVLLTAP
jgi:hypothetical protein